MDALHLVRRQLGEAQPHDVDRLAQLVAQQAERHPVGLVERRAVGGAGGEGVGLGEEALPPGGQGLLGLGRQVVDAIVVAVVAEERRRQRAGLQAGLPVAVGEIGERGGAGG